MASLSVITGATGHIGYALLTELAKTSEPLRLLLRKPSPLLEGFGCETAFGDVTDYDSLLTAFAGAQVVYHLAGIIELNAGNEDLIWKVNAEGTRNVVEACKACGVRRLVYASSVDAIPPAPEGEVMREIERFSPDAVTGTYAKTKAVATRIALDGAAPDFEVVVVQPSACIGPYDFKGSSIGEMLRMFMHFSFPVTLPFGGYNFVDVRDVAQGMIACADPAKAASKACYLLTGESMSAGDFIALCSEITGHKPPNLVLPQELALFFAPFAEKYYELAKKTPLFTRYSLRKIMDNSNFSYEKAARELGYRPRGARESLTDMVAWIEEYDAQKAEKE
ncbi:MAG: NAD-dependent epimerase/dehydratase family protein [Oscillospiraceae bacterium]|jgi:dihydroflavonol-4-reductase|nr:NAD-dependent epimerase/dehydratase family protein [Oscillospiraceae bacterium]